MSKPRFYRRGFMRTHILGSKRQSDAQAKVRELCPGGLMACGLAVWRLSDWERVMQPDPCDICLACLRCRPELAPVLRDGLVCALDRQQASVRRLKRRLRALRTA